MTKFKELKKQAIKLRKQGALFSEIAVKLGIAKSTAHLWTRDISLSLDQKLKIVNKLSDSRKAHIAELAALKKQRQANKKRRLNYEAKNIVAQAKLSLAHKKLVCAILFWCEGGKDVRAGIQFINSDPLMMSKFLLLLRECFPVDESRFRALLHLHDYHDPVKQTTYWSEITGIPPSQFHKPYLKPHTSKNIRPGYPGCISVRYLDAGIGQLLKAIFVAYGKS